MHSEIDHVLKVRRGEFQGLANIFLFEFRVLAKQLRPVWVQRHCFENPANRQPHTPYARLSVHLPGSAVMRSNWDAIIN